MKRSLLFFFLVSCFLSSSAFSSLPSDSTRSSNPNKPSVIDRMYIGGNLGLSFGTTTSIDISPLVGYRVSDQFSIGVRGIYQYFSSRILGTRFSIYGGGPFARYNFTRQFFAHVEGNMLSVPKATYSVGENPRSQIPFIFAGGGYRAPIGNASFFTISVLFDVLQHQASPYPPGYPIIQMGIILGR